MRALASEVELERSSVVASCSMNRERELGGANGYGRDLGIDLAATLESRLAAGRAIRWLDLCCGRGRALIEAATTFAGPGSAGRLEIEGVDLAGMFDPIPESIAWLTLREAPLRSLQPGRWDLITCVHGLHYVGDKLQAIARAIGWLGDGGLFVANLDLANVELTTGSARRRVPRWLREGGAEYDRRRRLVICRGRRVLELPWRFVGADDQAGPNYTGQPAVTSVYAPFAIRLPIAY